MNSRRGLASIILIIIAVAILSAGAGVFLFLDEPKPISLTIEEDKKVKKPEEIKENGIEERPATDDEEQEETPEEQETIIEEEVPLEEFIPEPTPSPGPLPPPVFTHHITDLSKIMYIVPPGSVSGNTFAEHSYLSLKESADRVPVFAPIDSKLGAVAYYGDSAGNTSYTLSFKVNENVFYYVEIIEVSAKIRAVSPSEPRPHSRTDDPTSPVFVKAGELIGYVGKNQLYRIWDFGVYDVTNRNNVANPERHGDKYGADRYLTGLCPYDFYPAEMKNEYLDLFSGANGTPVIVSDCRGLSQDVVGTAAGYWFLDSGSDETYGPQLVIASTLDGKVRWGGVGFSIDDGFRVQNSNPIDPASITVGESACYLGNKGGNLFIKLLSETELGVFYRTGNCPSSFPEAGYKVYAR